MIAALGGHGKTGRAVCAALAAEAGVTATRTDERPDGWLGAMFAYYDRYGLPVGTRTLDALLGRARTRLP